MPNGHCRMHGGSSPGASKGEADGNYRHGQFTAEVFEQRRQLRTWLQAIEELVAQAE
jgi:hypothetical protein